MSTSRLNEILEQLSSGLPIQVREWPAGDVVASEFGLFEGKTGDLAFLQQPDLLDIPLLRSLVEPDSGLQLTHVYSTGSTNTDLLERGRVQSIHNVAHLTEHQASGRGRRGRMWVSPFARSLALSIGFETTKSIFELQALSLAVGVAVCNSLRSAGAISCGLKWPNDVITSEGKLAGILVEHQMRNNVSQFVIGIGVNVALSQGEKFSIVQPVVDLRELGVVSNRTTIASGIIQAVQEHVCRFVDGDAGRSIRAFKSLHVFHDLECNVTSADGSIRGRVVDVKEDGSLVMLVDGERRNFVSGEVSLRSMDNSRPISGC